MSLKIHNLQLVGKILNLLVNSGGLFFDLYIF